jgi:hypothetical protein
MKSVQSFVPRPKTRVRLVGSRLTALVLILLVWSAVAEGVWHRHPGSGGPSAERGCDACRVVSTLSATDLPGLDTAVRLAEAPAPPPTVESVAELAFPTSPVTRGPPQA